MIYKVRISQKAEKDFVKIPKGEVIKIVEKIESLAKNPFPQGSKKIKVSEEDLYRIRQGNYRVLYVVASEIKIVEVRRIGHRKDIYRSL